LVGIFPLLSKAGSNSVLVCYKNILYNVAYVVTFIWHFYRYGVPTYNEIKRRQFFNTMSFNLCAP